jgi:hypothetical protein
VPSGAASSLTKPSVARIAIARRSTACGTTAARYAQPRGLGHLLVQADRGDLGAEEEDRALGLVGQRPRRQPGEILDGVAALLLGDVGQHDVGRDVAGGPDVRGGGARGAADRRHDRALVDGDAGVLEAQAVERRRAPDRQQHASNSRVSGVARRRRRRWCR